MNVNFSGVLPYQFMYVSVLLFWLLTAIVHVGFAFAVAADSGLLWRHFRRNTFLVSGWLWALATLLGGVFIAGIYWLVHHSNLRPQQPANQPARPEDAHGQ